MKVKYVVTRICQQCKQYGSKDRKHLLSVIKAVISDICVLQYFIVSGFYKYFNLGTAWRKLNSRKQDIKKVYCQMWICTKICDVDLDKTHRKCHSIIGSILTIATHHSFFETDVVFFSFLVSILFYEGMSKWQTWSYKFSSQQQQLAVFAISPTMCQITS